MTRKYRRDKAGRFAAGSTTVQQDGGKEARNSKNKKDIKRRLVRNVGGAKKGKRGISADGGKGHRTKRVISALEQKSRSKYLRKRRGKRRKRG